MKPIVLVLALISGSAYAFPLPPPGQGPVATLRESALPLEAEVDYTAIVALNNCSGSLVRFTTSLGDDRAMVLTNGHCLGGIDFLKPGEVRFDVSANRAFSLLSKDGRGNLGRLTADRVIYATMTNTDMTLYRLVETYNDIEKRFGLQALTLSNAKSTAGRRISIASGYWRKLYSCTIDGFVYQLKEDAWTFTDSIRYSEPGCDTIHGTSGSPIIDSETREVVGVNNTGNDDGESCTMNNPCEVDPNGNVRAVKGSSYGQQVYWLYGCLGPNNQLDLNHVGCQLPK